MSGVAFAEIKEKEAEWIKKRRVKAGLRPGNPVRDAVGLALSGGGIRSATFNLGILQAFHESGLFKKIDYLSTVSGGGYIGSALTWFMARLGKRFPFAEKGEQAEFNKKAVAWLRGHGKYLTPGAGLDIWSLIAAVVTGTLVNLCILVPFFLSAIGLLKTVLPWSPPYLPPAIPGSFSGEGACAFLWIFACGLLLLAVFFAISLGAALLSRFNLIRGIHPEQVISKAQGKHLLYAVLLIGVGSIPLVYAYVDQNIKSWIGQVLSLSGIVSMVSALMGREKGNEARGLRSFLLAGGLSLFAYGLVLFLYHLTEGPWFAGYGYIVYLIALGSVFLIGIAVDMNHVSMHRFYRNRLMEAYMPFRFDHDEPAAPAGRLFPEVSQKDADMCKLSGLCPEDQEGKAETDAPYQIINANLQTVGSRDPKLRERGGDNFIFSPFFCGSAATGYLPTEEYLKGHMNLATAMAVSGAAVDPNTYATRSRPLTFIMALLNLSLGYWITNPKHHATWREKSRYTLFSVYYLFREMFGEGLNENQHLIRLSDGGHFENLGLYELVRRRCRHIIVCDATADKNYSFDDLFHAMELVKSDFDCEVLLEDFQSLIPDNLNTKISKKAFIRGQIHYHDHKTHDSDFIFFTTALIKDLPEEIYAYQRKNRAFPDEGTMDQFFNALQFESYRRLGYEIGKHLGWDEGPAGTAPSEPGG